MAVFATLDDVKRHANITGTGSDAELQDVLDAAQERVEALIGSLDQSAVTERVTVHGGTVLLSRRPVVGDVVVNGGAVTGFTVNREAGLLYDVPAGSFPLVASYTAGRSGVPASVTLATAIVAAHLWETQRGSAPSPLAVQGEDVAPVPGQGYALPSRARELLEPFIQKAQVG